MASILVTPRHGNLAPGSNGPTSLGSTKGELQICIRAKKANSYVVYSDTKERFVFSKGNYIEYHGRRNFARIDHIFLFDVYTERHVFAIITPLRRTGVRDELIDLEILQELNGEPLIIGIMAIEPAKPYLVQINDIGVVHVEWSVKWL